jgi:hypothetical protein
MERQLTNPHNGPPLPPFLNALTVHAHVLRGSRVLVAGIDPEERPSTPTERRCACVRVYGRHTLVFEALIPPLAYCRENERLNQTLHWPVSGPGSGRGKPYKKYDDKTNTWKTVYITLEDEEKIKWYTHEEHMHRHGHTRTFP